MFRDCGIFCRGKPPRCIQLREAFFYSSRLFAIDPMCSFHRFGGPARTRLHIEGGLPRLPASSATWGHWTRASSPSTTYCPTFRLQVFLTVEPMKYFLRLLCSPWFGRTVPLILQSVSNIASYKTRAHLGSRHRPMAFCLIAIYSGSWLKHFIFQSSIVSEFVIVNVGLMVEFRLFS